MTAMQDLIEYLEGIKERDNIPDWVIITARNHLEQEKQQKEGFAIGFAEWLRDECYDTGDKWLYQDDDETYDSQELLEMYKKEKGL